VGLLKSLWKKEETAKALMEDISGRNFYKKVLSRIFLDDALVEFLPFSPFSHRQNMGGRCYDES
jgi:hypothetical protein